MPIETMMQEIIYRVLQHIKFEFRDKSVLLFALPNNFVFSEMSYIERKYGLFC